MRTVRIAYPFLLLALLAPATASAQTPPPDERAAAQAIRADAAKRLLAAGDALDEDGDPDWLEHLSGAAPRPARPARGRRARLRRRALIRDLYSGS